MKEIMHFQVYFTRESILRLLENPNSSQFSVGCRLEEGPDIHKNYSVRYFVKGYDGDYNSTDEEVGCPQPCNNLE